MQDVPGCFLDTIISSRGAFAVNGEAEGNKSCTQFLIGFVKQLLLPARTGDSHDDVHFRVLSQGCRQGLGINSRVTGSNPLEKRFQKRLVAAEYPHPPGQSLSFPKEVVQKRLQSLFNNSF